MRKALVVGINDYKVNPLNGCVNDANAIKVILETHEGGAPNFGVKLLTSPGDTIDRAKLRGAVDELFKGDCDVALLYFSGHGFIKSAGGYLVTTDAKKYDEGVSMDEILNYANSSWAKNKVILLDCCHSGAFGTPTIPGNNLAQLSEGLSALTASRDFESAIEINGNGVFTALVVNALQGGAADVRGHITPGSIYAYVDQALGPWDQRPIFKTNVTSFTSLRTVAPRVPDATLRKLIDYFPSPQDEHKLDSSYEFTNTHDLQQPEIQEPVANPVKVAIFKDLQKFVSVGIVEPVDEEHMYYAAMNSKSCKLTALGFQYWRLVKEKRI
jgi:hypothetical protein